ncbi:MAG: FAD-dependent oxidoreductase [Planctomycetota bacterium]
MQRARVLVACLTASAAAQAAAIDTDFDVVVYGGTSAGVVAAVQLASAGKTVALVEPSLHVGGMSVCGLGATDVGSEQVIGGMARAFYRAIKAHYAQPSAWTVEKRAAFAGRGHGSDTDAAWTFEPHVAEAVFEAWVRTPGITLLRGEALRRPGGVDKERGRIRMLRLRSGRVLTARLFLDASYEGDLMAAAGVGYTVGREANATYGETLNGVQTANATKHQFTHPVDPFVVRGDPASGLLPGVRPAPGGEGESDAGVQAYCFRICATDVATNRRPWPEPVGYDERAYELLLRHFDAGNDEVPWHPVWMPNRKTDANNDKAVSTDCIGLNWRYPEADDEERARIVAEHLLYTQGLLWTLAHHPRVPAAVRAHFQRFGLAKDEFVDHDNWPYTFYVREARRMVGIVVMTELHCRGVVVVDDPVGMGAYNMDSHNVQRHVDAHGHVRNEGDVQVRVAPYGISLRALLPKETECTNLVVPVCVSASHIAFGSIRMEPVFMVLGQSAAAVALLALEQDLDVQAVPYPELRACLLRWGQVLEVEGTARRGQPLASLRGTVVDDVGAELVGSWQASVALQPFVGERYLHDGNTAKGRCRVRFAIKVPAAGDYRVQVAYSAAPNRAGNVPVEVHAAAGRDRLEIDQRQRPPVEGLWLELGIYRFAADRDAVVEIGNEGTDGYVVVDAVRLLAR